MGDASPVTVEPSSDTISTTVSKMNPPSMAKYAILLRSGEISADAVNVEGR